MAVVAIAIHPRTSKAVLRDDSSPKHPVRKGVVTVLERYVVGTDFVSGDSLTFTLYGAKKILKAIAKTPSNTFLATNEGGTVPRLTVATGTSTTDIQVEIVYLA
jgi:hypothetical protein